MTMKHTPGPWALIIEDEYPPIVQRGCAGGFQVMSHDNMIAIADAHLIAAAPDLLAACKSIQQNEIMRSVMPSPLWHQLVSAIAKAEGRV